MNDKKEAKIIEDLISQCNEAGLEDLKKRLESLLYDRKGSFSAFVDVSGCFD